jgi:hypothetical protein
LGLQIFFLRFLKSIGWNGFSYGFLVVVILFHQNIQKKLTKKKARSNLWTKEKKVNKNLPPPPKEIHRLSPIDLKIYSREINPRL